MYIKYIQLKKTRYNHNDHAVVAHFCSSKGFVQVRFFNKEKGVDIPWNIDVKLVINGQEIDLSKVRVPNFLAIKTG